MKAYFCLNKNQVEALGVDNGCRTIPADREVQACVCDSSNNCNVAADENVLQNAPQTNVRVSLKQKTIVNFSIPALPSPAGVEYPSTASPTVRTHGLDARDSVLPSNCRPPSIRTTTPSPSTLAIPQLPVQLWDSTTTVEMLTPFPD